VPFLLALLARPEFQTDGAYTQFIDDHLAALTTGTASPRALIAAAVAAFAAAGERPRLAVTADDTRADLDPWQTLGRLQW
jgi:hypothetical protein